MKHKDKTRDWASRYVAAVDRMLNAAKAVERIRAQAGKRHIRKKPTAFTLIELLVVIGVLLILALIGVLAFNAIRGADRMPSAARIVQSAFRGALDRAIASGADRGLRFIRDPGDLSIATGFVYVMPADLQFYGLRYQSPIRLIRRDEDSAPGPDDPYRYSVEGFGTNWVKLSDDGFIADPPRVKLPADHGQFYGILRIWATPTGSPEYIDLTGPFVGNVLDWPSPIAVDVTDSRATCALELRPYPLPDHEPLTLPSGVVIDLDWSSPTMASTPDILFTPRGSIAGRLAALGPIYLLLNDIQDATKNLNPIDPANRGEKLIVAIFPQTGNVQSFPIDPTDFDGDGNADNLFRFAQEGTR